MVNNNQTTGSAGVAGAPESSHPGNEEADNPPDKISGTDAAKTQQGQPGLPSSENQEWSPGSDQEALKQTK